MQAVLEFFAVGLTQLKHCLRFVSRLACGTKELKCKTVNPTKKMIDPFLLEELKGDYSYEEHDERIPGK